MACASNAAAGHDDGTSPIPHKYSSWSFSAFTTSNFGPATVETTFRESEPYLYNDVAVRVSLPTRISELAFHVTVNWESPLSGANFAVGEFNCGIKTPATSAKFVAISPL